MPNPTDPIRLAAEAVGAVRVDRGEALYVCGRADLQAAFAAAGFAVARRGALLALDPGPELRRAFAGWAAQRVTTDELLLRRLIGRAEGEGEAALLTRGLKLLSLRAAQGAWAAYDRALRREAALCLRKQAGGGALFGCYALEKLAGEERK